MRYTLAAAEILRGSSRIDASHIGNCFLAKSVLHTVRVKDTKRRQYVLDQAARPDPVHPSKQYGWGSGGIVCWWRKASVRSPSTCSKLL
jgi:hypothetical protein